MQFLGIMLILFGAHLFPYGSQDFLYHNLFGVEPHLRVRWSITELSKIKIKALPLVSPIHVNVY